MEEISVQIEGISQAVGCIDAQNQRSMAELSEFHACGRGQARFSHAALACE
jgi:hypothetical protein